MIRYVGQHVLPLSELKRDMRMRPLYEDRVEHLHQRYKKHSILKPLTVGRLNDELYLVGGYHREAVLQKENVQDHPCLLYDVENNEDLILLADIDNDLMEMSKMDRALKYMEVAKNRDISFTDVCIAMGYTNTPSAIKIKHLEALLDVPKKYRDRVAPQHSMATPQFPITMSHSLEIKQRIPEKKTRQEIYDALIKHADRGKKPYDAHRKIRKICKLIKSGLPVEEAIYQIDHPHTFKPSLYTPLKLNALKDFLSKISIVNGDKALDMFGQRSTSDSTAGILLKRGFEVYSFGDEVDKFMDEKPNLHINQVRNIYKLTEKEIGKDYKVAIFDPKGPCPMKFVLDVFERCSEYGMWVITSWDIRATRPDYIYPHLLRADHGLQYPRNTEERIDLIVSEARQRNFIVQSLLNDKINVLAFHKNQSLEESMNES